MSRNSQKDILLYVSRTPRFGSAVEELKKQYRSQYRFGILYQDPPKTSSQQHAIDETYDVAIKCRFDSPRSIIRALKPYQDQLLAISTRSDENVPDFQKLIPFVPYLQTPTTESLEWATNKLQMRRRFAAYDPSITPAYRLVQDTKKATVREIEKKVGFPLIIKPLGLATSLLVTVAYHHEELEESLNRIFRKINKLYRDKNGRGEPQVLVEQLMDGEMYSVDTYVDGRGNVHFTPFCHVKTGRSVGFDDFFAYQTITPTKLTKQSIADAQDVSKKAIRALGLRSTTAHIELLKTEEGWKVIEVGPRLGGFRPMMLRLTHGIDHYLNDFLIRIPRKPRIPRTVKGHAAVLKFYAHAEGAIKTLTGIKKAQQLASFYDIAVHKKVGDRAVFAKNGGDSVFNVYLFNKERSKLLADIRRLEKMVKIETK